MISDCIKQFLSLDVLSEQASAVQARNTDLWSSAAEVPDYAYKCLKDIWVGTRAASGELTNRIVTKYGEGQTASTGEIALYIRPVESVNMQTPQQASVTGAESTMLEIVLMKSPDQGTMKQMENTELRIRYLLDHLWRGRRKTFPQLPAAGDPSINGYILCQYDQYLSVPTALQVATRYWVSYYRSVPR